MSQRAEILRMLRVAPGRRVTSEQLLAAGIPRYSARIFELRGEGHRISMTPQKASKTVEFRLEFDVERDVESSRVGVVDPHAESSSGTAALSVTHKPMNPYEWDLAA